MTHSSARTMTDRAIQDSEALVRHGHDLVRVSRAGLCASRTVMRRVELRQVPGDWTGLETRAARAA